VTAPEELTRRWAVAVVGVPAALMLFYFGGWILGVPVAILAGVGARELCRLGAQKGVQAFSGVAVSGAAALVLAATWRPTFSEFAPMAVAVIGAVLLLSFVLALSRRGISGRPLEVVSTTLLGCTYVGLTLSFLPLLHELPSAEGWGAVVPKPWIGLAVIALPVAATWIGDSVAFFAGTRWGRSKIVPAISPNKSWVGSWSGLGGAMVAAMVWYMVVAPHLPGVPIGGLAVAALVGAVLGVCAQVGDLIVSLLKREAGVKDTGTIFPGHGGVLDRLDALAVTLPASFALFALLTRVG